MSNVIEIPPPVVIEAPYDACVLRLEVKMYERLKLVDSGIPYMYNKDVLLIYY